MLALTCPPILLPFEVLSGSPQSGGAASDFTGTRHVAPELLTRRSELFFFAFSFYIYIYLSLSLSVHVRVFERVRMRAKPVSRFFPAVDTGKLSAHPLENCRELLRGHGRPSPQSLKVQKLLKS